MIDNTVIRIINWIKKYFVENGPDCKAVIGISGGKDSTIAAALLCEALGTDRVIAVKMPQGYQHDIDVADKVIEHLRITDVYQIDIDPICKSIFDTLPNNIIDSEQVYTNTPARVRMTILYAIAAARHGRVVNTCNKSEDYVGYSTKFGDSAGDFSIFANYTVREVKEIGKYLDIPSEFIDKVPEAGLSGLTDEDNLGFTYEQLDRYLNDGIYPDYDTYKNIEERHKRNIHKIRRMPNCPNFNKHSRYDDI